jgi:ABC-type phosphate transport system substrate-binding protein
MRNYITILVTVILLAAAPARADLVVVTNLDNGIERLSRNDVINIFMGRLQELPSGAMAFPIDVATRKETFYRQLVNKTLAEINSYWARLVFSGRASPPRQLDSSDEVMQTIRANHGALGYLDDSEVDDRVRIVYRFPEAGP